MLPRLSTVPSCTWRWTIGSASCSPPSVSRAPMTRQPSWERWRPAANWTFPTPYRPCTVSRLHKSQLHSQRSSATVTEVLLPKRSKVQRESKVNLVDSCTCSWNSMTYDYVAALLDYISAYAKAVIGLCWCCSSRYASVPQFYCFFC